MTCRNRGMGVAALLALLAAGCESTTRQDPLFVRNSTDTLVFAHTPLFRDRPISDTLPSALELADYGKALADVGLLALLQRPGPFTVFAVPNQPMEAAQARGRLLDPATRPALRRLMAYTIVPGRYDEAALRGLIARARGPVALRTLDGEPLSASVEPATGQLLLGNAQGQVNRIWLSGVPQSNGVLYATQSLLAPRP